MNVEQRVDLMEKLGQYLVSEDAGLSIIKQSATYDNQWFVVDFINYQLRHIANEFLSRKNLENWIKKYDVPSLTATKNIGVVMAGNIPLAGFHDFLSVFISGHRQTQWWKIC